MKQVLLFFTLFSAFLCVGQDDTDEILLNYDLEGMVIEGKIGDKITLENLNFIGGSAKLLEESKPILEELLKVMKDNPNLKIQVQGHICCYQDKWHQISSARAEFVYDYLKKNGIKKQRISYKDFGGSTPLYPMPEENDMQREKNRRVEIEIIEN